MSFQAKIHATCFVVFLVCAWFNISIFYSISVIQWRLVILTLLLSVISSNNPFSERNWELIHLKQSLQTLLPHRLCRTRAQTYNLSSESLMHSCQLSWGQCDLCCLFLVNVTAQQHSIDHKASKIHLKMLVVERLKESEGITLPSIFSPLEVEDTVSTY